MLERTQPSGRFRTPWKEIGSPGLPERDSWLISRGENGTGEAEYLEHNLDTWEAREEINQSMRGVKRRFIFRRAACGDSDSGLVGTEGCSNRHFMADCVRVVNCEGYKDSSSAVGGAWRDSEEEQGRCKVRDRRKKKGAQESFGLVKTRRSVKIELGLGVIGSVFN